MTIELIFEDVGTAIYGLIERCSDEDVVHYEGSKTDVLSFYLGLVGRMGNA